ncbi:MAG: quinol:electron acceptor oxidoreductase subunit ActD [Anaerolineae bacterium]
MAKKIAIMGLFTDVSATADALEALRVLGLREEDMSIIQGVPYTAKMLGRPKLHEFPWFTVLGALAGFGVALFLTWGTLLLYPVRVGGRPIPTIPTSIVIWYELTMLGLMLGTFLTLIWKCGFPSTRPQYYDPLINHSRIALLCDCDLRIEADVKRVMLERGAEKVYEPERRPL